MDKTEVKFGEWIEKGFNLYKENFGLLILASLVAVLLSSVSLGVLVGPMFAGMVLITLHLLDKKEPKPQVGDIFKGFNFFLNSFLFFLVWGIGLIVACSILSLVPCIGFLVAIFLVYAVQAALMFALFLIVDKERAFWPASMESFEKVKSNFWMFLALSVVAGLIGSIGSIACGIGVFITIPIQICILAVAYREVFAEIETPAVETPPPLEDKPSSDSGTTEEKRSSDTNGSDEPTQPG
jgi:uncharacterized membrane protein